MAKPRVPKKTNGDAAIQPQENPNSTLAVEAATAETANPRKSSRQPSIVKNDARANVVPIKLEDEIRRLAYLMSERRGFEPGHETEDWLTAEREVLQRYRQHSA